MLCDTLCVYFCERMPGFNFPSTNPIDADEAGILESTDTVQWTCAATCFAGGAWRWSVYGRPLAPASPDRIPGTAEPPTEERGQDRARQV